VSLDGVIQAPGRAPEDPAGDFAHGGWTAPFMDDHGRYMHEALNTMGTLLLERLTYIRWREVRLPQHRHARLPRRTSHASGRFGTYHLPPLRTAVEKELAGPSA
jgi:hypothetical protein